MPILNRTCGECTLCCKLLPVKELGKPASTKCKYQSHKGCRVYSQRPGSCKIWSCSWLDDIATEKLSRPDRSHYVLDPQPDFIEIVPDDGGPVTKQPVLQIWVDPKYPKAHEDPDLRRVLDHNHIVAIVRYNSHDAFVMFPPSLCSNGKWNYKKSNVILREHTVREIREVINEEVTNAEAN